MALTSKEEKYCQLRATQPKLTQAQCYIEAGYGSIPTAAVQACKLETHLHIKKRIADLRDMIAISGLWSRESSINVYKEIVERTVNVGDDDTPVIVFAAKDADRINAVKGLNEMCGFNVPVSIDVNGEARPIQSLDDLYETFMDELSKEKEL